MTDFIGVFGSLPPLGQIKQELGNITTFSQSIATRDKFPLFAAAIAKDIGPKITPTQLRKFYTYVKSIEMSNKDKRIGETDIRDKYKLRFILPKIAGSGEKERVKLQGLYEILAVCLLGRDKIQTVGDLRMFVEFFEAILDYHASLT
ncbi:MAG: type III-A CRISPR-associated protein Csm2 [Desulfobulbaceae bacterium]|nr:type III-A CRISPR-associated protein Csm2 [Desulfobulbaceae bacterium]